MRNQTAFQTVENIVDLKQSRLSTHSQCSVEILKIKNITDWKVYHFLDTLYVPAGARTSVPHPTCSSNMLSIDSFVCIYKLRGETEDLK